MKIGLKTGQGGYTYEELSQVWRKADELGFDSAWLYDHFIALGNPEAGCLEAYTTLGALARDTRRLRIGVMVTCAPYRNPAVLAKIASTVDVISEGRFVLGLGAGWYDDEFHAYGFTYPSNKERVEQLSETLAIVHAMWQDERATFKGRWFAVDGAPNLPKPVQSYPPVLIGITKGTKVMPRIAIREADGFNTMAELDLCRQIIAAAESEREKTGREREMLTYSLQKFVIAGTERQIREIAGQAAQRSGGTADDFVQSRRKRGWLVGAPEAVAVQLRPYIKDGIDTLILGVGGDTLDWPLEVVKNELLPLLQG